MIKIKKSVIAKVGKFLLPRSKEKQSDPNYCEHLNPEVCGTHKDFMTGEERNILWCCYCGAISDGFLWVSPMYKEFFR